MNDLQRYLTAQDGKRGEDTFNGPAYTRKFGGKLNDKH